MANEFKIKNGLLIEGSTNSVPVLAIRNSSTGITADASSLLFTGKAIFDYVSSQAGASTLAGLTDVEIVSLSDNQFLRYDFAAGKWKNVNPTEASLYFITFQQFNSSIGAIDASIIRIDASLNNAIDAYTLFVPNASIGDGLVWNSGYLDVSVEGGGGSGLSTAEVSSNYTALSNYIILANSSYNSFDITLPASPANGDIIAVVDVAKNSSTNNINVLRNGHLINKLAENFTIDVNGGGIQLIYHSLNNNFAIENLETLVGYTSSGGGSGDVSLAYVNDQLAIRDASIVRIDSSINALFSLVLDTSTIEIGAQTVDGSWRLIIDTSGNLSVQKRITGSWVEKGNFN